MVSPNNIWRYVVCGLTIESNHRFVSLQPVGERSAQIRLDWQTGGLQNGDHRWFREWTRVNGSSYFRIARENDGYLIRFDQRADFFIALHGEAIRCQPVTGIPDHTVLHLLLDQVFPLVLSRRGKAVFHGSAVEVASRGIAFLGASGRGKSTLAAFLCRAGAKLITDDCLVTEPRGAGYVLVPSYPGVRVWPDSKDFLAPQTDAPLVWHDAAKRRIAGGEFTFASGAVPLHRVYFLEPPAEKVTIEELSGAALIRHLVGCHYLLDNEDPREMEANFRTLSNLASQGLCYRLAIPRGWDRLASCADTIFRHAAGAIQEGPIGN